MAREDLGRETAGGWGRVVEGEGNDHLTVTCKDAKVGEGFHITTETPKGFPNVRDYFDQSGKHLGTDDQ